MMGIIYRGEGKILSWERNLQGRIWSASIRTILALWRTGKTGAPFQGHINDCECFDSQDVSALHSSTVKTAAPHWDQQQVTVGRIVPVPAYLRTWARATGRAIVRSRSTDITRH